MPADLHMLLTDLAAETAELQEMIHPLADVDWQQATPAQGWTIAKQVSHLAYFDELAVASAKGRGAFASELAKARASGGTNPGGAQRRLNPADMRAWFIGARGNLLTVFASLDASARVPWFGPTMSVASSLTARLMETWAHGQDIADTLGRHREPTNRLRHVAHIGVGARAYSYAVRGLPAPCKPVRVDLTAPSGEMWSWGPADASDQVSGPALDFCLVVTQRRHRDDTAIETIGTAAAQWLTIAQAFAGPPGPGRQPGQFVSDGGA